MIEYYDEDDGNDNDDDADDDEDDDDDDDAGNATEIWFSYRWFEYMYAPLSSYGAEYSQVDKDIEGCGPVNLITQ